MSYPGHWLGESYSSAEMQSVYSAGQKQYILHKHQQNKNNQETKMVRKTIVWTFQATNEKNLSWENFAMAKREIESLLIAAQNNAITTM